MSLISDINLEKLGVVRKYLLRTAIWLLIAGVIAGIVLILFSDVEQISEIISKTMGNIFLVAAMMVVCVLGFRLLESKKKIVQIFSTICLCTSLIWVILWSLAIWAWEPLFMTSMRDEAVCAQYIQDENEYAREYGGTRITYCPDYVGVKHELTILFRLTMVVTIISAYSLLAALVMNMYEGKRKDLIRPLKIVSLLLAGYEAFYFCLMILMDWPEGFDKMGMLAGFAATIWFIVIIVAWVISHIEKNRDRVKEKSDKKEKPQSILADQSQEQPVSLEQSQFQENVKSYEELRVEIEEKVRREMIEKEVRERLERERLEQNRQNQQNQENQQDQQNQEEK